MRSFLIIFLLLIQISGFSQEFYSREVRNQKAIFGDELLDQFYGKKNEYSILYWKAKGLMKNGKNEEAIQNFKKLLSYDKTQKTFTKEDIEKKPYYIFLNQSCNQLAAIYLKKNNFEKALYYLDLSKKYPFLEEAGYAIGFYVVERDLEYIKCYDGLKKYDQSISISSQYILNISIETLWDYDEAYIKSIFLKYGKKKAKRKFEKALKKIQLISDKKFKIEFFDFTKVIDWKLEKRNYLYRRTKEEKSEFEKLSPKEQIKEIIKNSHFYKTLYQLL
ncbi:hypothetical protein [Aureivirga sp. CE67]|uniref:hypothetical protein n=1 Tax=Aureivirga sp. CE67 TaxID=1788983 RepID=UPI0018CAE0AE|nr:hypothetical protein [Aureivirga sp. CE67]